MTLWIFYFSINEQWKTCTILQSRCTWWVSWYWITNKRIFTTKPLWRHWTIVNNRIFMYQMTFVYWMTELVFHNQWQDPHNLNIYYAVNVEIILYSLYIGAPTDHVIKRSSKDKTSLDFDQVLIFLTFNCEEISKVWASVIISHNLCVS